MGEGLAGVPGVNLFCCCFFSPAVNLNKKQGLILKAAERFGSNCLFVCFLMETSCWLCVCVCVTSVAAAAGLIFLHLLLSHFLLCCC